MSAAVVLTFWCKVKISTVKNAALVEFFSLVQINSEIRNEYIPAKENILDFLLRVDLLFKHKQHLPFE